MIDNHPSTQTIRTPVIILGQIKRPSEPNLVKLDSLTHAIYPHKTSSSHIMRDELVLALDGCAILGTDVILTENDLSRAIAKSGTIEGFSDYWGINAKNSATAYILNHNTKSISVLPDPLGGSTVFIYKSSDLTFISSNIQSLSVVAATFGVAPRKSLMFQIERASFGNGGLTPAPLEDTKRLESFEYLSISNGQYRVRRYSSYDYYMEESTDYFGVLEETRQEILSSVGALSSDSRLPKISHLTGGFDSRLVTSAILEIGAADQYLFFCSGPAGTHDRNIADGLSATFGLTRTEYAGLRAEVLPTLEKRFLAPMIESAGMSSTGPTGYEQFQDIMILGGGYGEYLRSSYSRLLPVFSASASATTASDKLFGPQALDVGGLITEQAKDQLLALLQGKLTSLSHEKIPSDFVADALYSTVRNRFHIGQNSSLWGRFGHRFDPLYSIAGLKLAKTIPLQPRTDNVIGFDLMNSMAGNLSRYPFESERRSATYNTQRRSGNALAFTGTNPTYAANSTYRQATSSVNPPTIADPSLRKTQIARANKLGVNFWQISEMKSTQSSLLELLSCTDREDSASLLNFDYVTVLANGEIQTRKQIRDLYSIYATLLWFRAN